MHEDDEIIREFLIESNENLNRLDTEIVDLERNPTAERLASIFRTIHTIKGTCGFLGFQILESISHHAENILSQLRAGQRQVSGNLVSIILESVDAVRHILSNIEATGQEGANSYPELVDRLERIAANLEVDQVEVGHVETSRVEVNKTEVNQAATERVTVEPVAMTDAAKPESQAIPLNGPQSHEVVGGKNDSEASRQSAGPTSLATNLEPKSPPAAAQLVSEGEKTSSVADSSIRVDVSLLDKLMNLVGELVLARNQILQFSSQRDDNGLNATSQRLNLITSELQEGVMKTRMQPIGMIWNKLPRVVRDVAHALGKQLELEMEGAETELDKTIIEAIRDPLTHMVRNACDHGIEDPETRLRKGKSAKGTLRLKAYHEGGQVNIEISDDGAGIDTERVKRKAVEKGLIRSEQAVGMSERDAIGLLFLPGFSTAQTITNVSGRGVGMDVVRSNVEKIGGTVDISTKLGEGTTVKLKIPLTLAIIPGLLVSSGGHRFVIPQVSLLELIRLEGDALARIEHVHETPVYRRRGTLLPIASLNDVLKLPASVSGEATNIVVLQAEDRQFGLIVDGVNDTQEIVVKPLGKQLKQIPYYSGSTIMGDGAVALILDVLGVGQLSGVLNRSRESRRQEAVKPAHNEAQKQRLLLFRSGSFERLAVPLEVVARLEEIAPESIEYAGGRAVVQYRDQILPLIKLATILDPALESKGACPVAVPSPGAPLQVIVFSNEENTVGLIIDQIIDIVDEAVTMRRPTSPKQGILGSAVIGKKVVDFLDLQTVLQATGERFFGFSERRMGTVLVAETSAFNRSLLRSQLEMSGYNVLDAGTTAQALHHMERELVQVLAIGAELLNSDLSGVQRLRKRTAAARIPMLSISNTTADLVAAKASDLSFDDHQLRFEREAMLESIGRLAQAVTSSEVAPAYDSATDFRKAGELVNA